MRQRFAKTRAGSLTAAAVLAVAGLGSAAQANLVLDLRLAGGGNATTVTAGQTVNLEVVGTVTGGSSDQLQDAFFGVQNPSTLGNLTPVSLSGSYQGVTTDGTNVTTSSSGATYALAAGDGSSIGSTNSTSATGWVFARATSMQSVTPGTPTVLGTLQYQVSGSAAAGSNVNLTVNTRQSGGNSLIVPALWMEDSTLNDGSTAGTYTSGSGVTITIGGVTLAGDISGPSGTPDGVVNDYDLGVILNHWGANTTGSANGDLSGPSGTPDGVVNDYDLTVILNHWGQGATAPAGIAAALVAVPEPASLSVLSLGALGLLARRRRA